MSQNPDDLSSILAQYVNLGHAKRDQAFLRQVAMACSSPGTSAPQAAGKAAERVPLADALSLYRFVGNEKVKLLQRGFSQNTPQSWVAVSFDVFVGILEAHVCEFRSGVTQCFGF